MDRSGNEAAEKSAISIAMATRNGGRFLREQLESLAGQSRPPTELVVGDDRSDDQTLAVLRDFARGAPFPVRVEINERVLGSTKNFERTISRCQGDIIALADQDDAWEPEKLSRITEEFGAEPAPVLVFSDAWLIAEDGRLLGESLWATRPVPVTGELRARIAAGKLFSVLVRSNVATGATMAFGSSLRRLVLPIPEGWLHDAWIALLAAATGAVAAIPARLIRYRQHGDQQIGGRRMTLREQARWGASVGARSFEQVLRNLDDAIERLGREGGARGLAAAEVLRAKRRHFEARLRMRRAPFRRWYLAPRELMLGRYRRYDLGWKSLGQDLFLGAATGGEEGPPLWGARA